MLQIGWFYDNGYGVERNAYTATRWYQSAAEAGNAQAQFNMGICHQYGYGVKQCHKTAFDWFNKATEQNHRKMPPLQNRGRERNFYENRTYQAAENHRNLF